MSLKAYSVFDREAGPQEGACLVFARSASDARRMGWPIVNGWFSSEWIDITTRHLPIATEWLAEQEGVDLQGEPRVIETPKSCCLCDQWGDALDSAGRCETCQDIEGEI